MTKPVEMIPIESPTWRRTCVQEVVHGKGHRGCRFVARFEVNGRGYCRKHAERKAGKEAAKKALGLIDKYRVFRVDGGPMGWSFVLDARDPMAPWALNGYAWQAGERGYASLSTDLISKANEILDHFRGASAAGREAEPGDRVGALQSIDEENEVAYLIGYGEFVGWEFPPIEVQRRTSMGIVHNPNPTIMLDSGERIYGCEVWWGTEANVREMIARDKLRVVETTVAELRGETVGEVQDDGRGRDGGVAGDPPSDGTLP